MSASTSVHKTHSIPSLSTTSLAASHSVRSHGFTAPSTSRTVITAPPWAQDEPPSPTDKPDEADRPRTAFDYRPSDVTSSRSSFGGLAASGSTNESHWWTFARPRPTRLFYGESTDQRTDRRAVNFKDRPSWLLPGSRRSHYDPGFIPSARELEPTHHRGGSALHLSIPPTVPFTVSHNKTPGWDTPWQPPDTRGEYSHIGMSGGYRHDGFAEKDNNARSRKKRFRAFILTNIYVPLLFRFINITFTTAALAIAIRIRLWEMRYGIMGIVGSSPFVLIILAMCRCLNPLRTLVIIFAPLTLVHVMVAIYLEYFGRPLGLWRTSGKLAHTLLEVCFICAWSASLSLSFDNFFTSLIPCASSGSTAWYNQLPQPQLSLPNLGRDEGGVGDTICDNQLALICLVGVGLIMYCINLVISLFRIFEKVKYHAYGVRPET
ncbi:hypothetical protein BV22DRAFT_30202 [Leucogyrophana mollusca]|uniref:Uncharacterized protein n=1 Tax=Leucogyrophana mollusca TaxID=85980 RepID=A0ACB8C1B3_9AGAM|nr:hypothetical protein BV22DRAFT_30202 [Leucogyrophana mollusca]